MLHQDDITVKGRVAVWIGSFTDELEADDYLNVNSAFERDFGFRIAERRGPEMAVVPQPVSIRELVEGFSCWRDYADAVVTAAHNAGIESASTMLVAGLPSACSVAGIFHSEEGKSITSLMSCHQATLVSPGWVHCSSDL